MDYKGSNSGGSHHSYASAGYSQPTQSHYHSNGYSNSDYRSAPSHHSASYGSSSYHSSNHSNTSSSSYVGGHSARSGSDYAYKDGGRYGGGYSSGYSHSSSRNMNGSGSHGGLGSHLKNIDWSRVKLVEFTKDFYQEHPNVSNMSHEEVEKFRFVFIIEWRIFV